VTSHGQPARPAQHGGPARLAGVDATPCTRPTAAHGLVVCTPGTPRRPSSSQGEIPSTHPFLLRRLSCTHPAVHATVRRAPKLEPAPNQSPPLPLRHCARSPMFKPVSALVSIGCRRRGENDVCPGLPLDVYPHHLLLRVAPSSPRCHVCACHRTVRAPSAQCSCVLVAYAYRARSRHSFAGSCARRASGSHLVCMLFHVCKYTCCPHTSSFT
jgi:hypothetical protein